MRTRRLVAWCTGGIVLGLIVLGPGMAPGSLLSLDLVLTPRLSIPSGAWGLGPELPQRVPLGIPLGWLAAATTGPFAGKALIVAAVAMAFVGVVRLTRGQPWLARAGAGVLYAAGPFALTRAGAGHLNVLAASAVLPFVLPTLMRCRDGRRTFLAALALGLTGSAGGALAVLALAVGLVAERTRASLAAAAAGLAAQAIWIAPNVVALWSGASVAGADAFPTRLRGWSTAGLLAGDGFWRSSSQVGSPPVLAVVGLVLVGLAVVGRHWATADWSARATVLAGVGLVVAMASSIPGVRAVFDAVTDTPLGSPFRESQRTLSLYLVWVVPAAAAGAVALSRRVSAAAVPLVALPAALALAAGAGGWWGVEGRLEPVRFPADWAAVRDRISGEPGTVLALPWHEYLDLDFADGRRVLNPLPSYLDRDVISSFDPEVGQSHQEQNDGRTDGIDELVATVIQGGSVAPDLAQRGIRWVVLVDQVDSGAYAGLARDSGLDLAFDGAGADLYEVTAWTGEVTDLTGEPVPDARSPVRPLLRPGTDRATVWSKPAQAGWLRGWERADEGPGGRLVVPAGESPAWFWPAVVIVLVDAALLVATAILALRLRRGRRPDQEGSLLAGAEIATVSGTYTRQAKDFPS